MILYENTIENFLKSASDKRLINHFADEYFEHISRKIDSVTKTQWKYSMQVLKELITNIKANGEAGIRIDYVITSNYRWFEIVFAANTYEGNRVHVLQLLPFEKIVKKQTEDIYVFEVDEQYIEFIHPSIQAICYEGYIKENIAAISEEQLDVSSSVYFYESSDTDLFKVLSEEEELVKEVPIILCGEEEILFSNLHWLVEAKNGKRVLQILHEKDQLCAAGMESYIDKLFDANGAKNKLFVEQRYAASAVLNNVKRDEEGFFILNGMAGTGKTTVAISIMKELYDLGSKVLYLVASLSMVEAIKANIKKHTDAEFNVSTIQSFIRKKEWKEYDLIIVDEAQNVGNFLISEYMNESKILPKTMLFICSMIQCISEKEGDFIEQIKAKAQQLERPVYTFDLNSNIRFSGQSSGINWMIHQLQIADTGNYEDWDVDTYKIEILDNPNVINSIIAEKNTNGEVCRAIVRYDDIESISRKHGYPCISFEEYGFTMPVITAQSPHVSKWYSDKTLSNHAVGMRLVQGMELDYACVVIDDLSYDVDTGEIVLKKDKHEEAIKRIIARHGIENLEEHYNHYLEVVKKGYYVAISRGMKGVYIYCSDDCLRKYLEQKVFYAGRRYSWIKGFIENYDFDSEKGIIKKQEDNFSASYQENDKFAYVTVIYEKFSRLLESIKSQLQNVIDEVKFKSICDECSALLLDLQKDVIGDNDIVKRYTDTIVNNMGESAWDKLSDLSKKCLLSAEIIFHDLKDYNQIFDFSGVCVQVSKAVEYELAYRFLTKYVEYLRNRYRNQLMNKIPKTLVDEYGNIKTEDIFTLGDVRYTVGMDSYGNIKNNYTYRQFYNYAKECMFEETDKIQEVLAEQVKVIHKIKEDYRNKAAHKSSIDVLAAKECINYVIEIERKLGMMLDAYKF